MLNKELVRAVCTLVTRALLILHAVLLLLFLFGGVYPMVLVSLAAGALIGLSFLPLRQYRLRAYLLLLYGTILAETFCAVYLLGWSAGYQLSMILLVVLAFSGEYVGRSLRIPHPTGLSLSIPAAVIYMLLFLLNYQNGARLDVPTGVVHLLRAVWAVVMFGFLILILHSSVRLTTHSERVLADKASVDKLTGLYNRAGYDRLIGELDLKTTALLLLDADKFKAVNDTYGHETGDRVLVAISQEIRQNFRAEDHVCRIGGDEFVVLMRNAEGDMRELIRRKVNRINRELAHPREGLPIISLSVGVAFGAEETDAATLFSHADEALYRVKEAGGRDCVFYGE